MRAHYIVILERDGLELVVFGMSYPSKGQKPLGYNPEGYIEVEPDVYMMVGIDNDDLSPPFPYPTKEDAERWAKKVGGRVEFIP